MQSSIPYRNSSVRRSHLPWVSVTEKLLKAYRENPAQFKKQETGNGASAKVSFADKHKEWYSANVMMALVAAGSWVAHILGDLTPINYSIWALLLGVVCAASGLVPTKPLQKSNSYGLMMVAVFGSIIRPWRKFP